MAATDEVLYPNLSTRYGFRDVSGYDWPLPIRVAGPLRELGWRVAEGASLPRSAVVPRLSPRLAAFLSRCGVRVLYTDLRVESIDVEGAASWPQVAPGPVADAIYLNPAAQPRARLAPQAVFGSEQEALAALLDPNLNRPSIVEPREGRDPRPTFPAGAAGAAVVERDDPESITIAVDSPTGGLVELADRMASGWTVKVNGAQASAFTVDYLFRGVAVPPGRSQVVWKYEAPGFRIGAALSVATLLVVGALFAWPKRTA
jgi:hypothetical protein